MRFRSHMAVTKGHLMMTCVVSHQPESNSNRSPARYLYGARPRTPEEPLHTTRRRSAAPKGSPNLKAARLSSLVSSRRRRQPAIELVGSHLRSSSKHFSSSPSSLRDGSRGCGQEGAGRGRGGAGGGGRRAGRRLRRHPGMVLRD
jgi:hypothetical protein